MLAAELLELVEQPALAWIELGEIGRDLRSIALAHARDDRVLRGEVAIEIARTHPGFHGDVVHRCRMEAGARENALGRVEDADMAFAEAALGREGGDDVRHASDD